MKTEIIYEDEESTLIRCTIWHRTSKAVALNGTKGRRVYLPLSQIEIVKDETTFNDGNVSEILIPNWLIEQNDVV